MTSPHEVLSASVFEELNCNEVPYPRRLDCHCPGGVRCDQENQPPVLEVALSRDNGWLESIRSDDDFIIEIQMPRDAGRSRQSVRGAGAVWACFQRRESLLLLRVTALTSASDAVINRIRRGCASSQPCLDSLRRDRRIHNPRFDPRLPSHRNRAPNRLRCMDQPRLGFRSKPWLFGLLEILEAASSFFFFFFMDSSAVRCTHLVFPFLRDLCSSRLFPAATD